MAEPPPLATRLPSRNAERLDHTCRSARTMNQSLKNKCALVTGGSRGIGAAIVKRLASEGAHVALTYSSSPDRASVELSRLAISTPSTWRRPSQSMPMATSTARERITAFLSLLLIPCIEDQIRILAVELPTGKAPELLVEFFVESTYRASR